MQQVAMVQRWLAGNDEEQSFAFQTSANTVDLRGKRAATAMMMLEEQLTEKASDGVVFVVHGVGTGALWREVQSYLRAEPSVKRFELEERSNGGCTVVYFK
jgi:DNA mismatch repair protein MutS2